MGENVVSFALESHAKPESSEPAILDPAARLPFKASLPAFGIGEPRGQDQQEPSVVVSRLCETPSFTIRPSRSFVFLAGGLITHTI
jgi:hypothetical protein